MPVFIKDDVRFDTELLLREATSTFAANPSILKWNRMLVAMMAHQQAHFMGNTELIVNHVTMSDTQCEAFVNANINSFQ